MHYHVQLRTADSCVSADGDTEQEAIDRALADSVKISNMNAYDVALLMFAVYTNDRLLRYATTLGKYRLDVA
jgi:hypothetical protein